MEPAIPEPASLEYLTTVSARGIAPAKAVVEHLNASQCRLRTVVLFDVGDTIEFTYGARGAFVRGTVFSRAVSGSRFIYTMRLDRMSAKELEALARSNLRNESSEAQAPPGIDCLTRSSPRVLADFQLTYRTPKLGARQAFAIDISTNGMMMSSAEKLVAGVPVELHFTLPPIVPPPVEMTVGARIVSRQELNKETFVYGLAFTCLEDRERKTLSDYVEVRKTDQRG